MMREMFVGKLHRATVSRTEIDYPGSLTVDEDLLDLAGIPVYQKVQVVNINNGSRLETYVIPGERKSGDIIVNGAAARLAQAGDTIIIIAYALLADDELATHKPKVVVLGPNNRVIDAG